MVDKKTGLAGWDEALILGHTKLSGRSILVVDDNLDVASVTADLLRAHGHEVEVVHDGEAALAAVAELRPDTVLLDIALPGLNGYEVAARLRADPATPPELVIVGMTGWGCEGHGTRAYQSGFDRFWSKPLTDAELQTL